MSTVWTVDSGIYTATWDGVSVVTVTVTATGAFAAAFSARSVQDAQALVATFGQSEFLPGNALSLVASTGVAGFALQNATPNILSWTAPNDGQMHRATCFGIVNVTVAQTGGAVGIAYTNPDGGGSTSTWLAGGLGTGHNFPTVRLILMAPGTTITIQQTSAQTAGTATLYTEIWAS